MLTSNLAPLHGDYCCQCLSI